MTNKSVVSQCQIIVFPWKNNDIVNIGVTAKGRAQKLSLNDLTAADSFDISNYIFNCSFSKAKSDASGKFKISVANTHDWKIPTPPLLSLLTTVQPTSDARSILNGWRPRSWVGPLF